MFFLSGGVYGHHAVDDLLTVTGSRGNPDLPCRSVPVILTEASVTEGVIPLTARRGRGAVRLLSAAPFMGVEGDAGRLVAVGPCRSGEGIRNMP